VGVLGDIGISRAGRIECSNEACRDARACGVGVFGVLGSLEATLFDRVASRPLSLLSQFNGAACGFSLVSVSGAIEVGLSERA
jgi:hypothetical protein